MAWFMRFVLALASLPFAWSLVPSLLDAFRLMPVPDGRLLPPGAIWLASGFAVFLLCWAFFPVPVRLYVLGHELTHALWGLAFGARPSNLRVGLRGGCVTLTKSNVWITLAPYFFPFWTAIVGLLALVARCFVSPLPCSGAWLFAVGFTWCFHVCFTLRSLMQSQPDAKEYGYFFSYVLIWIMNAAGLMAWLVCTGETPWRKIGKCVLSNSADAYAFVADCFARLYEFVRSLPILQG
ncbi:MAG: hypothetical protein II649_10035 [Kiritimatiellae bacterium]|nr:hypothetical protein [Kiritimatiellia bacterium]